ncbi:MAG: phosphopantetheine-binding protein [Candidatus Binatia bacterium]
MNIDGRAEEAAMWRMRDRGRMGAWGLEELIEPQIRAVVAQELGVEPEGLTRDVSLREDLAADSLDQVELALALEETLGVTLPEAMMDSLRSYGELVERVVAAVAAQRRVSPGDLAIVVRTRIVPPSTRGDRALERATLLTAYEAQTIIADAARLGRDTRLEVIVPDATGDGIVGQIERLFAGLVTRGVAVVVQRERTAAAERARRRA